MNFSLPFLTSVVVYEIIILTVIFLATGITQYLFLQRKKRRAEEERALEHCVLHSLTQSVPENLPEFSLGVLLDALTSFDERLKGDEWELLKARFIKPHVQTLTKFAAASSWKKRALFVKGALLAPAFFDQQKLIDGLCDKKAVLRYMSAQVLAKRGSAQILDLLIEAIACESGYMKHTLRDALLKAPLQVFEDIAAILRKEKNVFRQIDCLEVLSQKSGVLSFIDVEPFLHSSNVQLRWWALKALENIPGENTCAVLKENVSFDNADIRCVVASGLGIFPLDDVHKELEILLTDSHWLVRLNSALSLKKYGPPGHEVLLKHKSETNDTVKNTVQYALDIKSTTYSRSMLRWLEARAIR